MKTIFLSLITCLSLFTTGCHQTDQSGTDLNFGFEVVEKGMPKNWYVFLPQQANYSVSLDSVNVRSGKYAIAIEFQGDTSYFQAVGFNLPHNYEGKKITLTGYIRTENVTGYGVGLWMRIDPDIAFDNMIRNGNGITGTTDWKKYEITLDMNPEQTEQIAIGGILSGKGKVWFDDLKITVDGKDIQKIHFPKPEDDREFEKGSNIIFPELNEEKTKDLDLLGKIWGLMKYHHPAIAKGNYNWDYELFRMLPEYLKTNNNKQRDRILIKWINKYGKISKCTTCQVTPDSAFLKPGLSWIEHSDINLKLKNLLHEIYLNRNRGRHHYYIDMQAGIGNPVFSNERTYGGLENPDAGFRLLALFRYWNMIQYFFPSKYLTDKDWSTVLKEYIPYFIEAKNRLEYELVAARLFGEICDSHAFLLGFSQLESLKGDGQVLALIQFVENRPVVMEYYLSNGEKTEDAELTRGDVITHIDGKSVEMIVDSMKPYYPASNEAARLRDIARDLLRSGKQSLNINYICESRVKNKINESSRQLSEHMYYQPFSRPYLMCILDLCFFIDPVEERFHRLSDG